MKESGPDVSMACMIHAFRDLLSLDLDIFKKLVYSGKVLTCEGLLMMGVQQIATDIIDGYIVVAASSPNL
jgi:hypothetical protein